MDLLATADRGSRNLKPPGLVLRPGFIRRVALRSDHVASADVLPGQPFEGVSADSHELSSMIHRSHFNMMRLASSASESPPSGAGRAHLSSGAGCGVRIQ